MYKDNREDIYEGEIDYSYIALMSKKLRIGVVGAGKAGTIKIKHFVKNKCYVEVLSKTFDDEIINISNEYSNLKLIDDEFTYKFLKDKHLVIIAVDDELIHYEIKKYCEDNYKIYIDSSNFKNGMGIVPAEQNTKNMKVALNTKGGNPRGAILVSKKIKQVLEDYDDFIGFTTDIRNKTKAFPEFKTEILKFIGSEEFKELYDIGKAEEGLEARFPKLVVDSLCNKNY